MKAAVGALAPFTQRSFRFQWPADLAASCAIEMEVLILGWYVLSATDSVVWLGVFGASQYMGTLISPMLGVVGDRVGLRRLLAGMRASYALLALALAMLDLAGTLAPLPVFLIAGLSGLVRPSDIGMRNALIGATMPLQLLMGAMGIARMSADLARILGALTGAVLAAWLGFGAAYLLVAGLYALSLALLLGVREPAREVASVRPVTTPWRDLGDGIAYVRATPPLLAGLCLAFLVNFAAFPITGGLLPYVARNVYELDRTGLGYLSASFASGALLGSLALSGVGRRLPPARTVLAAALIWLPLLIGFARLTDSEAGMVALALIGFVQSFCMVPLSVLLLRIAEARFRGRVMGLRMLAVYGLPLGLLLAGPLIAWAGFLVAVKLYAGLGLLAVLALAWHFRAHLLPAGVPANATRF
jgi:predicted MFS family arabinose efflux permease